MTLSGTFNELIAIRCLAYNEIGPNSFQELVTREEVWRGCEKRVEVGAWEGGSTFSSQLKVILTGCSGRLGEDRLRKQSVCK